MRKILSFFVIPIVVTFFFAGIVEAQTTNPRRTSETVKVKKGKLFSVTMPPGGTTGHLWMYLMQPGDSSIVKFVRQKYVGSIPKGLTGVTKSHQWTFQAIKVGTPKIFLVYAQPFNLQASIAAIHEITVNISK